MGLTKLLKNMRTKSKTERIDQTILLPTNSTRTSRNNILVESFYVAGYGGWGFNYVEGIYVEGKEIGLEYDVLAMTPNGLGVNKAAAVRVINVERGEENIKMDVQTLPKRKIDYIIKKLDIPLEQTL